MLIESNPADAYLTVQGLKQAGLEGAVVFEDGEKALEHLRRTISPDIICMDLSVPPFSGVELLQQLRSDPKLRRIPVVVMSGSESSDIIRKCYESGANCYINKPSNLDEFMRFMKSFCEFWGTVVTLPPKPVNPNLGNQSSAAGRVK